MAGQDPTTGHVKINPGDLTPRERTYYLNVWGFDPVADKKVPVIPSQNTGVPVLYFYEAPVPLVNDPELQTAGVTVRVRVEVGEDGVSHNRIVFARGDKSAEVTCVHTVIYSAPAREILELPGEKLGELVNTTEGQPAALPPWEHFAALKSFAEGLATLGIFKLLGSEGLEARTRGALDWGPFTRMQRALFELAPELLFPIWDAAFAGLLDRVPGQWIFDQSIDLEDDVEFGKFQGIYPLRRVFNNHPFLESLEPATREKLFRLLLELIETWYEEVDINGRAEENEIEATYSPRILVLTLTEDFVETLDPPTTYHSLRVLEDYQWYCRPENKASSPGKVRARELEAPFKRLVLHGLTIRDPGYAESFTRAFHLVSNPFQLKYLGAVFDDPCFEVPELLRGFDAAHLRDLLRGETGQWHGILANPGFYLSYHCMRLLLEREGLSPDNAGCLRSLITHHGDGWKAWYFPALVREFKFVEDLVRTTSREYAKKEGLPDNWIKSLVKKPKTGQRPAKRQ